MITETDIERITNSKVKVERLINNAVTACKSAETDWSKNFVWRVHKTMYKI